MAKAIILLVDNESGFLKTMAEVLEREGYLVVPTTHPTEARRNLVERGADLAILDIRLLDDGDEKDISGLTLAKDPVFHPIPKIILTQHIEDYQLVREALRPTTPNDPPPAVDFLAKKEGPDAMIKAVERVIGRYIRMNDKLIIDFDKPQSFQGWARQIASRDLAEDELNDQAWEIERLIRRLFYDYTDIVLDSVPAGRQGQILAWVRSRSRPVEGRRLLKCSMRQAMQAEKDALGKWESLAPRWALTPDWKESVHFGVIAYAPVSPEQEPVQWLAKYFQQHQAEKIVRVLEDFADGVGGYLYFLPCPPNEEKSLNSLYREQMGFTPEYIPEERFQQALQETIGYMRSQHPIAIDWETSSPTITFHLSGESAIVCPDPTAYIYRDAKRFDPPVLRRFTLGNMDGYNILVDQQDKAWVTDFASIGPAPTLNDFINLEARIRFEWVGSDDLGRLHNFETRLAALGPLEEPLVVEGMENTDLEKALKVIARLRQLAARVPGADPLEYHFGILFYAARIIATDALPERKVHALLAAAMICQGISTWEV